ncbi:hypothetical protein [Desulfogranum japonicum]|nr:hypothetical protein [Desulfogranum japonicum]
MMPLHPLLHNLSLPKKAAQLENILNGFRAHQAFKAAFELGLFELLSSA